MRFSSSAPLLAAACLLLSSCASTGYFRDGVFHGQEASYKVSRLGGGWERIQISDNDLAWEGSGGEVIAINAVCTEHGDPSLQVLTTHLLMGFEDKDFKQREALELSGRAALRTRVVATMDGVSRELELLVLKKDGCVYDLSYVAPPAGFEARLPEFQALVASFQALGRGR